jgi:uncharacterized RDD family membrane protein YckC
VLGRPLAEWWQRLVAILLDLVILFVPKAVIAAVVLTSAVSSGGVFASGFGISVLVLGIVFTFVDLAYFSILNGNERGQTVGQMALGITVRDQATGGAIDPKRAAVRILILDPQIALGWIPVIGLLALLYTIAAALSPLWDSRRQGFHDKVAKTDVVKVR